MNTLDPLAKAAANNGVDLNELVNTFPNMFPGRSAEEVDEALSFFNWVAARLLLGSGTPNMFEVRSVVTKDGEDTPIVTTARYEKQDLDVETVESSVLRERIVDALQEIEEAFDDQKKNSGDPIALVYFARIRSALTGGKGIFQDKEEAQRLKEKT